MAAAFSRRLLASALLALALLGASGCSSLKFWDKDKGDKVIEGSPEQLYRDAIQRNQEQQLPRRDPAVRDARGPLPVQRAGEAGPAGPDLRLLQEPVGRRGDRPGGPVHPRKPDASASRLRLLRPRPGVFRVRSQLARAQVQGRHRQAPAARSKQIVPVLPGAGAAVPEEPVLGRCPPAHDLPAQPAGGLRDRGGSLLPQAWRLRGCRQSRQGRHHRLRRRAGRGRRAQDPRGCVPQAGARRPGAGRGQRPSHQRLHRG